MSTELDKEIAAKITKWRCDAVGGCGFTKGLASCRCDYVRPRYSTKIEDAWRLIDIMTTSHDPWGLFEPQLFFDKLDGPAWHFTIRSTCGPMVEMVDKSAPMAIAKGALKFWEAMYPIVNQQ